MRKLWRITACMFLMACILLGQGNTGKIVGTVTDSTGGVVPDARLTATSPTTPGMLTATSDSNGRFTFQAVPIGIYTISVAKSGFATVKQFNLEVKLGAQVDYNPRLEVGQISQIVEVSEAAVSIDTTSSRTATNITQTQIDNLPKGRTFNSLLQMAPGVRLEVKNGNAGVGGYQVDGASGSENSFVIDGVDVSDIRRGSLRLQSAIPPEFVQEIEVKSSGFEAQHGGAAGGVINVATRAGSNQFHGQMQLEFTNNQFNPRPRGWYQRAAADANRSEFFAPKEDTYRTFYPGAIFSGPLLPNRVYFTAGLYPTYTRTERYPQYASGTRAFNREDINYFGLGRLDFAAGSKLQVNTSWIWSPQRSKGRLPNVDPRIAAPSNDLTVQGGWQPSNAYTAQANYSLTPTWLISAKYGYKYQNDKDGNYGLSGAPYVVYQNAAPAGVPLPGATGFTNVSTTFGVLKDVTDRHNVYLDSSKLTNISGQQHIFKFGYALARLGNDVEDDYTNGRFNIFWGDSFSRGSITGQKGTYGYYIWEDGVRHKAAVNSRNQGFYVQDSWRIHKRVTLNLGVRLENEFLPPYRAEQGGKKIANPVAFGWNDKIAPRLGGAWDVKGDGRWKVSGSFGYYYDVMKYELARGSFGGDYWVSHVYLLDNPNVLSLGKANPAALGREIVNYDNRTVPINAAGELEGIDPNIRPFKQRRINVALDHALANRLTVGVRYTRTDVLAGIEDIGIESGDDEVYLIGNPGLGETRNPKSAWGQKFPNGQDFLVPEATRQYNAVEFRLQGQTRSLNFLGSYTWSRLYGNWSGLANADESGRSDPGVSRAFDSPYYYIDQTGSQKTVFGRLGTDRPHEFKLFAAYDLKTKLGGTQFGLNQVAFSGTPDTTTVVYHTAPTTPFGRADMGRTPFYTQSDLSVAHTIRVSERTNVRIYANAVNLFNQNVVISRVTQMNRAGAISDARLPVAQFFKGYDVTKFVYPGNFTVSGLPQYNPIYGQPGGNYRTGGTGAYQSPREIRLGIRLMF
ncbi:MAG: TonB-dependent receptor [Acidobacteria bacterium]|nr:TonB-dependent receptor [Acidobacteriota bacterium]